MATKKKAANDPQPRDTVDMTCSDSFVAELLIPFLTGNGYDVLYRNDTGEPVKYEKRTTSTKPTIKLHLYTEG